MTARMDLLTALEAVGACPESRAWLVAERERNPGATRSQERWDACPRGDWLLWLAGHANIDRKLLVLAACACARLSLRYVPAGEDRPRLCIEVTERWCFGGATLEEVRAARSACWAYRYAYAAAAAADAAYAATFAADAAADDAGVVLAATFAARSSFAAAAAEDAIATYARARTLAECTYARARTLAECADAVRAIIPWATVERGLYLAAGGVL